MFYKNTLERTKFKNKQTFRQQSPQFELNRKRRGITAILLSVFVIVNYIFVLSQFSMINYFSINNLNINIAQSDLIPSLQSAVNQALEGKYLGLFDKKNIYIYPSEDIKEKIISASQRVESVEIQRKENTLNISIKEKRAAALFCTNLPDFNDLPDENSDSKEDCYFADEQARIYMYAPVFSTEIYNRYYYPALIEHASTSAIVGSEALPRDKFENLQKLYENLRNNNVVPKGILIVDDGEYELYISNPNLLSQEEQQLDNIVIYLDDRNDLNKEISNLLSFWEYMLGKARVHKEDLRFDSIDLRYGSNVYYRLQQ